MAMKKRIPSKGSINQEAAAAANKPEQEQPEVQEKKPINQNVTNTINRSSSSSTPPASPSTQVNQSPTQSTLMFQPSTNSAASNTYYNAPTSPISIQSQKQESIQAQSSNITNYIPQQTQNYYYNNNPAQPQNQRIQYQKYEPIPQNSSQSTRRISVQLGPKGITQINTFNIVPAIDQQQAQQPIMVKTVSNLNNLRKPPVPPANPTNPVVYRTELTIMPSTFNNSPSLSNQQSANANLVHSTQSSPSFIKYVDNRNQNQKYS